MELSINAIITIVIAFLVLGLGIGLINGILSFGTGSLAQAVDSYRIEIPASPNTPLVVANPVKLRPASSTVVFTNIYNANNVECASTDIQVGAWLYLDCADISFSRIQTQLVDIQLGDQKPVGFVVDVPRDVPLGTYPCVLKLFCENRDNRANRGIIAGDTESGVVLSKPVFVEVS